MIAATVFLLIFSLISLSLSGLVVITILHARFYKARQNIFVLLTATFDFMRGVIICVKCVLFFSHPVDGVQIACEVIEFFHTWSSVGCLLGVFTVIYDRLAYIMGPVTYKDRMSIKIVIILNAYVFVHSLFCAILPFLGWGKTSAFLVNKQKHLFCTVSWAEGNGYGYFLLVLGYILPVGVVIITGIKLSGVVRRRIQFIKTYSTPDAHLWPVGMRNAIQCGRLTEVDASYVTIWRALSMIILACILSWLIYIGNGLLLIVGQAPSGVSLFTVSTSMVILTITTHIVNALVFGIYNKRYRYALMSLFACGKDSRSDVRNISSLQTRSPSLDGLNDLALDGEHAIWSSHASSNRERPPVPIPKTVWVDKSSMSYA